jgi:ABC-type molybdate transport system substrate-binding protein
VTLPDRIDLSSDGNNRYYKEATVTIPVVGPTGATPGIPIPATRVAWGLTIPTKSANRENAIAFVNLVLGAAGRAALTASGPAPITPAAVSAKDRAHLPQSVQALVAASDVLP